MKLFIENCILISLVFFAFQIASAREMSKPELNDPFVYSNSEEAGTRPLTQKKFSSKGCLKKLFRMNVVFSHARITEHISGSLV